MKSLIIYLILFLAVNQQPEKEMFTKKNYPVSEIKKLSDQKEMELELIKSKVKVDIAELKSKYNID